MVAVRMHAYGKPVRLEEVLAPVPARAEVVVAIEACAVNHLDLDLIDGTSRIPLELPHILGLEGVGRIHAIGEGVSGWRVGDRVMVLEEIPCGRCEDCVAGNQNRCDEGCWIGVSRPGCYAEFVAVPAGGLLRLPDGRPAVEWAAVQGAFGTAWHMLITRGQLRAGETVLINAAGSGIGSAAVQVARLAGARVIATAGSQSKLELALELGAETAVSYAAPGWGQELLERTSGRGVDLVYDHVGGSVLIESLNLVRKGGRIVTCGAHGGETVPLDVIELFRAERSIIGSRTCTMREIQTVIDLVAGGRLEPVVDSTYLLGEAAEAHARMRRREHFGKIVLRNCPDPRAGG
jgi:NADPH:quinone reductase-like Zn-dependent oxidoreductase